MTAPRAADARPSRRPPIARARGRVPPRATPEGAKWRNRRREPTRTGVVVSFRRRSAFFFLTHAGVLPRLGRTDDVDARVDGAIDSGDDRLTPSPKMPHPHGFARSLFGDATVWRSATRETRGAFIVALRRVVRAPTHTMSAISMSTVHVAGAVASARAPAASRGARRGDARARAGAVGGFRGRPGGSPGARAARGARPGRARRPRLRGRRAGHQRGAHPARAHRSRAPLAEPRVAPNAALAVPFRRALVFAERPNPNPVNPAIPRRARASGRGAATPPRRALARPRPRPHPRPATRGPPRRRRAFPEPRDDDRIRRARDTRTGFFRAPRTASRFIHTTLASIFFRPDAAP